MLALSKKFFDSTDYIKQGFEVCFNPMKNKLTFYKHEKAQKNITDLEEIAKHVNQLPKATFTQIEPYYNLHTKIKCINELIQSKKITPINLEYFNENFKPAPKDLIGFSELNALSKSILNRLLIFVLDEWIKEKPQETNRLIAKDKILDVSNKKEPFLDLSGLDLSSLPDIFDMGSLQKLIILDFSENQLTDLPKSMSKLSLKILNLSSNNLKAFPEAIAESSSLEKLDLEDNVIEAIPENIKLPSLTDLNLDYNELKSLPRVIGTLSLLTKLGLGSNDLEDLPPTIGSLNQLVKLNMSDTSISGIPMQILDLPNTCVVDFTGCDLPESVLLRLSTITNSPDYAGPRIIFSVNEVENEERSIKDSLKELYRVIDQDPKKFPNLEETTELRSWLHRLSDTADYQQGEELQKHLAYKIIEYLNQANENQKFRETFYAIIQDASETCGDRVTLSVLRLGIAYKLTTIAIKDIKKLADFLTRGVWIIDMLEDIARNKILTLPLFDEVEVYLGYPIKLKKALNIPIDIEEMLYFTCSALKSEDLQEAKSFVEKQLKNKEAYYEFLVRNNKWQEALSANYKEEYEAILDQRTKASKSDNPNYVTINQKFQEQLKKLTERALLKRPLLDNSSYLDESKKLE